MKKIIGITLNTDIHHKANIDIYWLTDLWNAKYKDLYAKYDISIIFLVPNENFIDGYIDICDGIIISGNRRNINPTYYQDVKNSNIEAEEICTQRTDFEITLVKKCITLNKPLMGICGGCQVLNVALGGSLIQHIPTQVNTNITHLYSDRFTTAHDIHVFKDSLLYKITGTKTFGVNSAHVQAVDKLGNGIKVIAKAPDGVIEAIEVENQKFCLGIQWHPEYYVTQYDKMIFEEFCRTIKFNT